MKVNIALAVMAAALSGAALAGGAGTMGGDHQDSLSVQLFQQLDVNHDGYISEEEAQGIPELTENWQDVDANRDGQLDQGEFSQFEVDDGNSAGSVPGAGLNGVDAEGIPIDGRQQDAPVQDSQQ